MRAFVAITLVTQATARKLSDSLQRLLPAATALRVIAEVGEKCGVVDSVDSLACGRIVPCGSSFDGFPGLLLVVAPLFGMAGGENA